MGERPPSRPTPSRWPAEVGSVKFRGFIKLALRNLAGNEPRSWLLGVCACCIAAVAVTTVLVVHGAQESLHLAASRLGADVVVVPRGAQTQIDGALLMGTVSQTWMPSANVARIAAVRGVAVASPQIYLESLVACLVLRRQPHVHRRLRPAHRLHGGALAPSGTGRRSGSGAGGRRLRRVGAGQSQRHALRLHHVAAGQARAYRHQPRPESLHHPADRRRHGSQLAHDGGAGRCSSPKTASRR